MNPIYDDIKACLLKPRNTPILILTHFSPDLDAIASSFALSLALDQLHIPNQVLLEATDVAYQFLPGWTKISFLNQLPEHVETIVCLDTASLERLHHSDFIRLRRVDLTLINIDHHLSNTQYGDINLIEDSSSLGEILFHFFQEFNWKISVDIADCLYASILSDTGGFRYVNVTAQTMACVSQLIQYGAHQSQLAQSVFESKRIEVFQTIKLALDHLVVDWDYGFAYTYLPQSDFDFGQDVIDFIRVLDKIHVFLVFREYPDRLIRISLRSKSDFDVSHFAGYFGGGGHKAAAGIKLKATLPEAIEKVISKLKEVKHKL